MIYLMNSAVMPAGNYGIFVYRPATVDDLAAVLRGEHGEFTSAIGYSQNADLIERWTGIRPAVNRIETRFRDLDRALVMRLKSRVTNPATKGAPVSENPDDWEFAWVEYADGRSYVLGGGAKKQRRDPSGREQRQNLPSRERSASEYGTISPNIATE